MNVNGFVSLDGPFASSYRITSLPLRGTQKIIAPYWANVDTRGTGQIFYRQSTDPSLLARATSEIQLIFKNVTITSLFIATWDAVGYYSRKTDKVNLITA